MSWMLCGVWPPWMPVGGACGGEEGELRLEKALCSRGMRPGMKAVMKTGPVALGNVRCGWAGEQERPALPLDSMAE